MQLLLALCALATLAWASKHVDTVRIQPSHPGSWTPTDENVRFWVPLGDVYNFSLAHGHWKAGHGIQLRLSLNSNEYDPIFDRLGTDTWASGVECRYNTSQDDVAPAWRGCWDSYSDVERRADAPQVRWKQGSEVIAATHLDLVLTGDTGGSNNPKIDVLLLVRDYLPEETTWETDALGIDIDNPDESIPLGVAAAVRFAKGFVNTMSRIPTLGKLFEVYARYIVNDVTTINNNGLDTGNIQAYVNEGDPVGKDPTFWDTAIHELRVSLNGPFVILTADWDIYSPHFSSGNPFKTIRSKQVIEFQLSRFGLIQTARQFVNTILLYLGRVFDGAGTVNVDSLCDTIQRTCNNSVPQNFYPTPDQINMTCPYPLASDPSKCSAQQYANKADCVAQISPLPLGVFLQGTGPNQFCVEFHANVAAASEPGAEIHCLHASRYKFPAGLPNDVHTPCQ